MASALHAVRAGTGPRVFLVHGSAADHTAWTIQLASALRERFTLIAYDRPPAPTVEDHAAILADLVGEPGALVVGSSFGAVISLELVRSRPDLCAGAILIEPPMAASDTGVAAPAEFLSEFDRRAAARGGPAAGEYFLREVLGDPAFDRIPRAFQERSAAKWREIRADCVALLAYQPRYADLAAVSTPMLLLGGDRSAPYFRATLDALRVALPAARFEIVTGAGHMLHAEAPRAFNGLVAGFADEIGLETRSLDGSRTE